MPMVARLASAMILVVCALRVEGASAATLDDVRMSGTLRIAYREDAPPFSYNSASAPTGFMVELCRAVAQGLGRRLGLAELTVIYVPVTSADRFDAITSGKADLLCEATTQTLERRRILDFSISTFADGASFMTLPDGPDDLSMLDGKKVGVLSNTTTEAGLRRALREAKSSAEVVTATTHQEGLDALEKGAVAAYFADRAILAYLAKEATTPANLMLADVYLSIEPYALAMRRGDSDFRLAVDGELSRIYRSGEIDKIFTAVFGPSIRPSPMLQSLYATAALPD
ncbi:MAG: amino acid ABC transporter substrate-binding protein [Bradyrhizobium sp.]|nr:amino acid ABC transporter substrate-binding protein [Bradyrhizobium sp.]